MESLPPSKVFFEIECAFRFFDEDGDGKISPSELRSCLWSIGQELSPEDAAAIVESSDSDSDGLLGLEDFIELVGIKEEEEEEVRLGNLREAFKVYEMEGIGCITPRSLSRALARLGRPKTEEECEVMIHAFDTDGNGMIDFDEFVNMMH